jgi:hypothetical protein
MSDKIDPIALYKLERTLAQPHIKYASAYDEDGVGDDDLDNIDINLLKQLVALARSVEENTEISLRQAHRWGFEQGWEEAKDCIGSPTGIKSAWERFKDSF